MSYQKVFKHVLIIDDDYMSQYLTRALLEGMAISREILTASDGREALDTIKERCLDSSLAQESCPDLILLDISMPIMNGFEVVEELQKLGKASLIKKTIIVLTSSCDPKDKYKMQKYGVRRYVEKPLSEKKLWPLLGVM